MRGRQFSIASADQGVGEVELLIAIVKYKTVIKRIRQGVCTRYIASLRPDMRISITIQKGGLGVTQKEVHKPVVMVGPGTGVAPMRSLVYQRIMWREELGIENPVKDVLFFGCRNRDADYFFKDEWEELEEKGVPLSVWAAFSRDQVSFVLRHDFCFMDSLIQCTAPEGLRSGLGSSTRCTRARRSRQQGRYRLHLWIFRQNATSHSRSAH
jgi:sulfite reductase alpha subunit-like flavoprotein